MTLPDNLTTTFRAAVALLACWLMAATVWAAEPVDPKKETPHALIEDVTEVLFDVVQKYDNAKKDAESYYDEIQSILEPVVDFDFIAKAVMGSHRSDATDEQVEAFVQVFKRGLVTTYAKGIANYVDSEISIRPPGKDVKDKRRVSVDQEVKHDGSTYRLSYTMAQNRSGEWKLINLVLDGVNLGRSFRSQFGQAAKKYNGDLDKVIDNWLDEM